MSTFDRRRISLKSLNSLTKYPSIATYHQLDPRNGGLTETATAFPGQVVVSEKVDGTNSRVVLLPDGGYLLGSREELLYADGDLIGNPALGIVDSLRPVADELRASAGAGADAVRVFYLELYGGKIGSQAKNYSTSGAVGWRLFDIAVVDDLAERLSWSPERISGWRDSGGQSFAGEQQLRAAAGEAGLELTPRLATLDGAALPADVAGMHEFLRTRLPHTLVALDETGKGVPEGIVLRSPDRSVIAKARFQDYERTLKRRADAR
jgi:hypothetical protein